MSFKKRNYTVAEISKKAEESLLKGHPWIYDTEIRSIDSNPTDG